MSQFTIGNKSAAAPFELFSNILYCIYWEIFFTILENETIYMKANLRAYGFISIWDWLFKYLLIYIIYSVELSGILACILDFVSYIGRRVDCTYSCIFNHFYFDNLPEGSRNIQAHAMKARKTMLMWDTSA